jgi:serine/threonine protein kinase
MAPEQFDGKGASVRSDIYALGLVLYEIYTGKRVFKGTTLAELRAEKEQQTRRAPSEVRPGVDPMVERLIMRSIERDPRQRPASAAQLAAALPGGDPLAAAIAAGETPFGYGDNAIDSAFAFDFDPAIIAYIQSTDASSTRWNKLASMDPVFFWYRESPRPLEHNQVVANAALGDRRHDRGSVSPLSFPNGGSKRTQGVGVANRRYRNSPRLKYTGCNLDRAPWGNLVQRPPPLRADSVRPCRLDFRVYVYNIYLNFPMTFQTSAWYSGIGFAGLLWIFTLTLYGFWTSVAGQPLLNIASADE